MLSEIFPCTASEADINPKEPFEKYEKALAAIKGGTATADDAKLLDLSIKLFENDAARYTSILTRAGTMMSAITLAATLVTGVGFTTFGNTRALPEVTVWVIFGTFGLALFYLSWTTVLLFMIQGRDRRSTVGPDDVDPGAQPPSPALSFYPRAMAAQFLCYTIENYKKTNVFADQLWKAQKCFRNALLVLVIGGITTAATLTFSRPQQTIGVKAAQQLAHAAGCADLPALTAGGSGNWSGSCLRNGVIATVTVDAEGQTQFR